MIYRVVLDNTMDIHTPDNPLLNPSVELEMNSAGSFNFTLPPDHPAWGEVKVLKTTIDVYEDNELIFTGRVANIDKNWNNERVVECEGALAYFNDSIQRQNKWADPLPIAVDPDDQPEDPADHIQNFLEDILNNHNTFVPENRRIYMGHIYIDHCDVTREVDYDTTLDVLTRMCIDTNGGWFMIRKDSTDHKLYLDWLKDFTQESDQKAQFGLNLLNFDSGVHAEDVCTGVLAKGADVDDQTIMLNDVELVDPTTYPEMSVTHYTDHDQDILWHREGVEKFGEVVQVHDFSDAEIAWKDQQGQVVANSLFEMARKWLEDKNTKIETIEVEVADLGWLDEGVPVFRLGQIVELNDAPHMTGEAMRKLPMYKISCDLNSGSKKVTLGTPPKKELTQISASNSDADTLSTGSTASGSGSSSGGSGSKDGIKDVKVNGTSVVDDGVANVSVPTDYVTTSTYNSGMATKASVTSVENLATAVGILDTTVQGKQDAITFNTLEAATEHLTKLKANGVVYDILGGGGTDVEANPSGSATDELEKIRIGQTIYSLPEGGGTDMVIPTAEYATSERNSTSQVTYEATGDFNAIAINLSVNGEASNYVQTCGIATTGTIISETTNSRDTWSNPNRNYAIRVDSLNLSSGDDVIFSNTGTANYITRLRGIIKLNTEVKVKSEISNVITADNNNNSRTIALSPDKAYMVLAFGISGNGGNAGDVSVTGSGFSTSCTLSAQSVKMICTFIVGGSSVDIVFGNDTNYYSKGHIVYEIDIDKTEKSIIKSGTSDPSGGDDGDLYLKISTTAIDQDVFGTPVSNTGDDYEISTDVTIYSAYDAYKAFGTGDGWGKNGTGWANLIYHFKNGKKAKIKSLTYCNNFNVSGGYLCSWFTFYGSNDGTNWTQLYNTNSITSRDDTATVTISTDTYYEYFKFSCNYTSGYTGLKGIVCIGDIQTVDPGIEDIFFKDNGVWLKDKFIKDADSFVYLPTLYSEEEREIGVWTDGKPVYQKTLTGNMNRYTSDWVEFGFVSNNIETVIYEKGVNDYNGTDILEESYITVKVNKTNGKCYYYCSGIGSGTTTGRITIQYTKTTDQPGSGTWTPEGQLAHHYSTSEKIVGTWIDGSTLYERTWDFSSNPISLPYDTWVNTTIQSSDGVSNIISAECLSSGFIVMDGNEVCVGAGGYPVGICAKINHGRSLGYLTLRYTKSS